MAGLQEGKSREEKSTVSSECIYELFEHCFKTPYKASSNDRKVDIIQKRCLHLLAEDYEVKEISNKNGAMSNQYPVDMYVPLARKTKHGMELGFLTEYDFDKLRDMMVSCRLARCRQRFVVPAIFLGNKVSHTCLDCRDTRQDWDGMDRSVIDPPLHTLHCGLTLAYVLGLFPSEEPQSRQDNANAGGGSDLLTIQRSHDIKLLKHLKVSLICDLMVENKMVKFGLPVTSSEKVDKGQRYHTDFHLVSIPYPGCEFFKEYRENDHQAQGLHYDWSQPMVDADFNIPSGLCYRELNISWENYQSWDLVELTQNYMKFLIQSAVLGEGGMLIHCVSGWDRTPLFVSLLRLSLWADGRVHQSLCAAEILYFTVAYDWLLFGHQFLERLGKGEAIFAFCFDFLQYITSDEYTIQNDTVKRHSGMLFQTDSDLRLDGETVDVNKESPSNEMDLPSLLYKKNHSQSADSQPFSVNSEQKNYSTSYGSWQVVHCISSSDFDQNQLPKGIESSEKIEEGSRCNKLNKVRKLFWETYRLFSEETSPSSTRSLTGLLSKLATSVGMGGNPNT